MDQAAAADLESRDAGVGAQRRRRALEDDSRGREIEGGSVEVEGGRRGDYG